MTPSKPWRVIGFGFREEHRSKKRAYEAVADLTAFGRMAEVYHWKDGKWELYERIEPAEVSR